MKIYTDGSLKETAYVTEGHIEELRGIEPHFKPVTVNESEYIAVIRALGLAWTLHATDVEILSDSQLIVNQLNGTYKTKEPRLQGLALEVLDTASHWFKTVKFTWIPREENKAGKLLEGRK